MRLADRFTLNFVNNLIMTNYRISKNTWSRVF